MDINSFVNSVDLDKYLGFLNFQYDYVYRESDLRSIDEMFVGNNYLAIILLYDDRPVGHFVVLRKDSENEYSYMDCLGMPLSDHLASLFADFSEKVKINILTKRMMAKDGIICGKYCILFCLSGDTSLEVFYESLSKNKKFSPDSVVNNLLKLEYERIF